MAGGRTAAKVGAAANTWSPWEGHGAQPDAHSDELLGEMVPHPWITVAPSMTVI